MFLRPLVTVFATALGVVLPTVGFSQDSPAAPRKSYVIPALEIIGFDALLNIFDRIVLGADYRSNFSSIRRNLRSKWVEERDPYEINQFGHPYQGSVYHGFARSSGHGYWAAAAYTFAGSALWEIAGEVTTPSRNDQIASGIAGSFLGESFYRIGSLILENAAGEPGARRQWSSAIVAPWAAFNRKVFGRRFDAVYPSDGAAYYRTMQLGVAAATGSLPGSATKLKPNEARLEMAMEYGFPGAPDYRYQRPFDYFTLQATLSSANGFENVLSRGLLYGDRHDVGKRYRGVWGLFGSYDYIAPQIFRVSSTALSVGSTSQWAATDNVSLQSTGMLGVGYAAVGTANASREVERADEYHYGVAPQALLAGRLILRDRVSFDLTAREFFVSDIPETASEGSDNIARVDAALTIRLHRQRAISLKYQWSRRDASYPEVNRRQARSTLGIFYTMLGNDRFGAVDWR